MVIGSLLNLSAVAELARERGEDAVVLCAGYKGAFAIDDAYCAGRIVALLGAERTDAAVAAEAIASRYPTAWTGSTPARTARRGSRRTSPGAARESVLEVVPRFVRMAGAAAEVTL